MLKKTNFVVFLLDLTALLYLELLWTDFLSLKQLWSLVYCFKGHETSILSVNLHVLNNLSSKSFIKNILGYFINLKHILWSVFN